MKKITINTAKIKTGDNWTITYNTLSDLDPEDTVYSVEELEENFFDLFTQDLVLIESDAHLIDVGWTTDSYVSTGQYYLLKLKKTRLNDKITWDWDNPIHSFETRSLKELLLEIERVTNYSKKIG